MSTTDSMTTMDARPRPAGPAAAGAERAASRPMVSVVVPAYNEAAIIEANLAASSTTAAPIRRGRWRRRSAGAGRTSACSVTS